MGRTANVESSLSCHHLTAAVAAAPSSAAVHFSTLNVCITFRDMQLYTQVIDYIERQMVDSSRLFLQTP